MREFMDLPPTTTRSVHGSGARTRGRRLTHTRRLLTLACVISLSFIGLDAPGASAATWSQGATVVVKQVGQQALVDIGTTVCRLATNSGTGGACVPFGAGNAVKVTDVSAGLTVAYQACVDNDGNGKCGGTPIIQGCSDLVFYSHDDSGAFFNPLGPLPTGFRSGCPGGRFRGYVIFVCQGVHVDGISPHTHLVKSGTATLTTNGTGYGNFCGPGEAIDPRTPPKTYVVI